MNQNRHHLFLIAEIERVLSFNDTSVEVDIIKEQKQVLEKVRSFLSDLQPDSSVEISQNVAQEIAQAVVSEIGINRSQWLQPIQLEINELNQHRDDILKEIRQLELQRQEIMTDFLKVFSERFNDSLEAKINKTLKDATYQLLSQNSEVNNVGDIPSFSDISIEYLAQLQQFQDQSDQILKSLDLTFRTVFESLKIDAKTYENALTNGLKRIYNLGLQSENVVKDYLAPNSDVSEPFIDENNNNLSDLEIVSDDNDNDSLNGYSEDEVEDWINQIEQPELLLEEEPEIRPLLEIDLSNTKKYLEKDNVDDKSLVENVLIEEDNLSSDKLSYTNEENNLENQENVDKTVITDLSILEDISDDISIESLLFGNEEESFTKEKPLSSLDEILFPQSSPIENESEKENTDITSTIATLNKEETDINGGRNVILNSATKSSSPDEIKNQEIDTIKLLTDLLEEGALDNIDTEDEIDEEEVKDHEILRSDNENLLPNSEEEIITNSDIKENLTPDKLQVLDEDLANFGGEDLSQDEIDNDELETNNFPSPWDELSNN